MRNKTTCKPESNGQNADSAPIAALASGAGAAAIAVIRVSGEGCHGLLNKCLTRKSQQERRLFLSEFIAPETSGDSLAIDEPLVAFFNGPKSFTGQDAAEIYCHGGSYIVQRILAVLYRIGFRPAQPGEFTRRAFLNGKLDLTAAEGIRELVEAQSHQQWLAARQLATGKLRQKIEELRKLLIEAMAYLEARIDFPDEGDTAAVDLAAVRERVGKVALALNRLADTYEDGKVAARGLMVALLGEPNAGKSTLLNTLLGRERAIVTATPGTTRDYLEESCLIQGRLLRLVDMAGLRESADEIERIGVETAQRLAKEADVVLLLVPADGGKQAQMRAIAWVEKLAPKKVIEIIAKTDLGVADWAKGKIQVSCKTGEGIKELSAYLAKLVDAHVTSLQDETFVTTARHMIAIENAQQALAEFFAADKRAHYEECLAFELQNAARALSSLIGDVSGEDILDKVFRDFCIGK